MTAITIIVVLAMRDCGGWLKALGQPGRGAPARALSHLASKGSHAALRQFVNPLDSLNPLRAQKQVVGSKNG